jgi:hypothetical protein
VRLVFAACVLLTGAGCATLLGIDEPAGGGDDDDTGTPDAAPSDAKPGTGDAMSDGGPGGCAPTVPSFGGTTNYGLGASPATMAAGDLNHDGFTDVAVGVKGGIRLFRGMQGGALASPTDVAITVPPAATIIVVVADIDGDSFDDLIWAEANGGPAAIFVSRQSSASPGTFLAQQSMPANHNGLGIGQLSDDATLDIVGQGQSTPQVMVQRAAEPGVFDPGPLLQIGGFATVLAVTDVDLDGRDDVVLNQNGTLKLVRQNPTMAGMFLAPTVIGGPVMGAAGAAVGRIDDDALPDLVTYMGSGTLYLQDPVMKGTFDAAGPVPGTGMAAQILDVNGDGRGDVLNMNSIALACPAPAAGGTFSPLLVDISTGSGGVPVTLVDISNDGKPDALWLDFTSNFLVVQLQE